MTNSKRAELIRQMKTLEIHQVSYAKMSGQALQVIISDHLRKLRKPAIEHPAQAKSDWELISRTDGRAS